MTAFFSVVKTIGKICKSMETKVIVEKSTVPVGTALRTKEILTECQVNCVVVSMPEFLAEGSAIKDLVTP